jgi:hypothetical protein
MEWIAGKATPSPTPNSTRAAISGTVPAAAAWGVITVKSDHRATPAVSTGLPPYLSAREPAVTHNSSSKWSDTQQQQQADHTKVTRCVNCTQSAGAVSNKTASVLNQQQICDMDGASGMLSNTQAGTGGG